MRRVGEVLADFFSLLGRFNEKWCALTRRSADFFGRLRITFATQARTALGVPIRTNPDKRAEMAPL